MSKYLDELEKELTRDFAGYDTAEIQERVDVELGKKLSQDCNQAIARLFGEYSYTSAVDRPAREQAILRNMEYIALLIRRMQNRRIEQNQLLAEVNS